MAVVFSPFTHLWSLRSEEESGEEEEEEDEEVGEAKVVGTAVFCVCGFCQRRAK